MTDFDYRTLNDVIHSRVRLAIMSFLMTANQVDFTELKRQLNVSDGNLSTHLAKLEKMHYVDIEKSFVGKKPMTTITLSKTGKEAFGQYIKELTAMIGQ